MKKKAGLLNVVDILNDKLRLFIYVSAFYYICQFPYGHFDPRAETNVSVDASLSIRIWSEDHIEAKVDKPEVPAGTSKYLNARYVSLKMT